MEIDTILNIMIGVWGLPIVVGLIYWSIRRTRAKLRENRFRKARGLPRSTVR